MNLSPHGQPYFMYLNIKVGVESKQYPPGIDARSTNEECHPGYISSTGYHYHIFKSLVVQEAPA